MDVWLESPRVWKHREVDGTHRHGFDWIWCGLNGTMLTDLQMESLVTRLGSRIVVTEGTTMSGSRKPSSMLGETRFQIVMVSQMPEHLF